MTKMFNTCILTLILISGVCLGQEADNTKPKFIRAYIVLHYPVPPFARAETEIANYQICYRNVLPPKNQRYETHSFTHRSIDTIPKYQKMEAVDYDSIVNFILTSGLLDIDLNYTQPDTTGGVVCFNIGGATQYVIETSQKKLVLPFSGGIGFKRPEILVRFDSLFRRVTGRYSAKKKMVNSLTQ